MDNQMSEQECIEIFKEIVADGLVPVSNEKPSTSKYFTMSTKELRESHPAAEILPMMNEEELGGLKESIRVEGQKVPIVLCDGKILDGRNRFAVCRELGIDVKYWELPQGEDPWGYVASRNMNRRNLTQSQKAAVAVKYMNRPASLEGRRTSEWAAQQVGVSSRQVECAKELRTKNPQAFEDVFNGKKTLNAALSELKEKTKVLSVKEVFSKILQLVPAGNKPDLEQLLTGISKPHARLIESRIREIDTAPLTESVEALCDGGSYIENQEGDES